MLNYYYPKTLWGVTIALADVFNDFTIYRYDTSGGIVKSIEVPLVISPVTKMQQAREVGHPSDQNRYYQHVPKMALRLQGIIPASDRAMSSNEERFWLDEALELTTNDSVYKDFQPTPYDYNFTLFIRSNSMEDLSQILENILPYFNPKIMLRVKEFSFLNVERDLPVELTNINLDFTEDMDSEAMREVNAYLDFTLEGWQYKPVTSGALVKIINSNFFIGQEAGYNIDGTPIIGENTFIESHQRTEGFNSLEDVIIPSEGISTSGYNIDTNKYWVQTETSGYNI